MLLRNIINLQGTVTGTTVAKKWKLKTEKFDFYYKSFCFNLFHLNSSFNVIFFTFNTFNNNLLILKIFLLFNFFKIFFRFITQTDGAFTWIFFTEWIACVNSMCTACYFSLMVE